MITGENQGAVGRPCGGEQQTERSNRIDGLRNRDLIPFAQVIVDGVYHHADHLLLWVFDGTPYFVV